MRDPFDLASPPTEAEAWAAVAALAILTRRRIRATMTHCPPGVGHEDMEQEVAILLFERLQRWDPARGVSFRSYARMAVGWTVACALRDALPSGEAHQRAHHAAIAKGWAEFTAREGRSPTAEELAEEAGRLVSGTYRTPHGPLPLATVQRWLSCGDPTLPDSLDRPVMAGGRLLGHTVGSGEASPEALAHARRELPRVLLEVETLPPAQRDAILRRARGETLREVGARHAVTANRIWQVGREAAAELRRKVG